MKKIISAILCTALSAMVLCSCADPTVLSEKENLSNDYTRSTDPAKSFNYNDGADSPDSYSVYANEITDFELRLFRNYYDLSNNKNNSFVIAPSNSVLQLAMLANGASEATKYEIMNALGNDLTMEQINQCTSYFNSRMEAVALTEKSEYDELAGKEIETDKSNYIKFDTNFFFNDITDIKKSFLQTNASYYGADIFRFMFSDDNALLKLNNHFSEFTESNTLDKLDENDYLISITASDINDTWLEKYAESDIEKGIFKSTNGERTVNFMSSSETYVKTDKAQGIIKYTASNPLKLMLVMPNEDISLEEYIADFNNLEYNKLFESIDITKRVTAKIPEFSVDSSDSAISLSEALTKSGLYSLFTDVAGFSEISHNKELELNEMYEISPDITVNAAGIGGTKENSGKPELKEHIKADTKTDSTVEFNRPFIFVLLDNESNIPVYIGTNA